MKSIKNIILIVLYIFTSFGSLNARNAEDIIKQREVKKFNYFLSSKTPQLDPIKREKIFVDFLESLSEEESKVVLMIKDQKFKYKGITRKLLMECIPEIFNGEELGKSNG